MAGSCTVGQLACGRLYASLVLIWIGSELGKSGRWCSTGGDRWAGSFILIRTSSMVSCVAVCPAGKFGTGSSEGETLTSSWSSGLSDQTFVLPRANFVSRWAARCVAVRATVWARSAPVSSRCPPWAASRSWPCSFSAPVRRPRRRSSFGAAWLFSFALFETDFFSFIFAILHHLLCFFVVLW